MSAQRRRTDGSLLDQEVQAAGRSNLPWEEHMWSPLGPTGERSEVFVESPGAEVDSFFHCQNCGVITCNEVYGFMWGKDKNGTSGKFGKISYHKIQEAIAEGGYFAAGGAEFHCFHCESSVRETRWWI